MKRKTAVISSVALLAVLAGCRTNTESNETAVHVTGYDVFPTSAVVKDCVAPSTNKYIGFGDAAYVYPAGQRSYSFGPDKADHPPISVVANDSVTMTLTGGVTFYLDTECEVLKRFHAEIGSKKWNGRSAFLNDGDQGWNDMLDFYVGNALKNVFSDFASKYSSTQLYTDSAIRVKLQSVVADQLPLQVEALAHGPYFQKFTVSLNKPDAPEGIKNALEEATRQIKLQEAQVSANKTDQTKYKTLSNCKAEGLSEQTCAFIYAVNSGHVSAVPQGSVVMAPPAK